MRHRSAHPIQPSPAPPPPIRAGSVITRSATVALCRVLNALRDGWFLEKRLRNVARMIAEEAHHQRLDVDQMLSALKEEWPRLLESRRVPGEVDVQMVVERLLGFCKLEFYSVAGRGLR
ncbi:MAG: hypothetical protein JWL95_477 [Gemmatimonadetes bacterium]|nr:hypothetical protein [Gemmatimonadota bacterium]